MAIMKLSNVPELTEFAGTEKIYVNDNGETKQIACDKVVTAGAGGSGRVIFDMSSSIDLETLVSAIENGDDVWILKDGQLAKILSYARWAYCGSINAIAGSYISISRSGITVTGTGAVSTVNLGVTSDSYYLDRLATVGI
jgi:hypothetical protein